MTRHRLTVNPHTIGGFDFYEVFDGNTAVITELMLPAGTIVRPVEIA